MTWFTGILTYILIWWTALFVVLPWGIRHEMAADPAERGPGAPVDPGLQKKFMITTILSAGIWLVIFILIEMQLFDMVELSTRMIEEDRGR